MLRILITGGVGFLGTNLSKKLLTEGHTVLALDNLQTARRENINELKVYPNFRFIEWDVQNPYHFEVDQIYNLACPASPVHYQSDPLGTIKTSILGAINALDLATKLDIPILQSSTSEVYGDPAVHPQNEIYWGNVNPIGIRACYDEGKRAAETLFMDYRRSRGTKIKIARIFNTYGPNMQIKDGRVVSNFIIQALSNEDLTVFGEGTQTRSFCYVDDLIDGLQKLMSDKSGLDTPVNLGNPEEVNMKMLAESIVRLTKSKSVISYTKLPADDPLMRNPDIRKATERLQWTPKHSLEDGLKMAITYFKKEIEI